MAIQKLLDAPGKRIRELEKLVERQAEQIDRLRAPRVKLPRAGKRPRGKSKSFLRVFCGDSHGAYADPAAVRAFLSDLAILKPAEVIHVGDILEAGSFLAQHHVIGTVAQSQYTFEDDVRAANDLLDGIQSAAPGARITLIEGNHDCLERGTEVLTREGWKTIEYITLQDIVASIGSVGETVWDTPIKVHAREHDGDLLVLHGLGQLQSVTPEHRVMYWSQYKDNLRFRPASSLIGGGGVSKIPCAGRNLQCDYALSDDEIELSAWLLTDGRLASHGTIYQSKPALVRRIRCLLTRMGLPYREVSRDRAPMAIAGVAVKSHQVAYEFHLLGAANDVVRRLGLAPYKLPAWAFDLSARQAMLFFRAMVAADACVAKSGHSGALYGRRDWLSQVQQLTSVNGIRTALRERKTWRGNHWVLNFSYRDHMKIEHRRVTKKPYSGTVHCLTMPQGNFLIRYDGRVSVTGNCRIEKACVTWALQKQIDAAYLRSMFSPEAVLSLAKRGVRFVRRTDYTDGLSVSGTIKLDFGVLAQHGEAFSGPNATRQLAQRLGMNVIHGHNHRLDTVYLETAKGVIGGWGVGCLCQRRPLWNLTKCTDWSHGFLVMCVEPDRGFTCFPVPIIGGVSFLQPMLRAFQCSTK